MKRKLLLLSTVLNALCVAGFEAGAVPLAELRNQLKQVLEEGAEGPYAVQKLKEIEVGLIGKQKEILTLLKKIDDADDRKPFSYTEDDHEIVTTPTEAAQALKSKKKSVDNLIRFSVLLQEESESEIKAQEKQEQLRIQEEEQLTRPRMRQKKEENQLHTS